MIRVGVLRVDVHIAESSSLKEKRLILKGIKDKIRNNFNVSVSEVDNHDKWQLASFGISCISNDKKHIDAVLNKIRDFIERQRNVVITDHQIEII